MWWRVGVGPILNKHSVHSVQPGGFVSPHFSERSPAPPSPHSLIPCSHKCVCARDCGGSALASLSCPYKKRLLTLAGGRMRSSRRRRTPHVRLPMQVFMCVHPSCALVNPHTHTHTRTHAHNPCDPSLSALVGCHGYSVASLSHVAMRLGPTDLS